MDVSGTVVAGAVGQYKRIGTTLSVEVDRKGGGGASNRGSDENEWWNDKLKHKINRQN